MQTSLTQISECNLGSAAEFSVVTQLNNSLNSVIPLNILTISQTQSYSVQRTRLVIKSMNEFKTKLVV